MPIGIPDSDALRRSRPQPAIEPAISPRMTAVFGGLFGLATVASIFALLIQVCPINKQPAALAQAAAPSASAPAPAPRRQQAPIRRERHELPPPWRVEDLKATHLIEKGEMKRRSFTAALGDEHVPKDQVYRILKAMEGVYKLDHPRNHDKFVIALERSTKKVAGFEYIASPIEIYQARQNDKGLLEAKKLDLRVEDEDFATAFYVGKDLAHSYAAAGLEPGLTKAMNEALGGQTSTEAFQEGGVVRLIAVETTALGRFVGYHKVKAIEYRPPAQPAGSSPDGSSQGSKPPVRAYWFEGESVKGYVDDHGRHASNAGWRTPIPGAPVTSHFNPKRMHPLLHKIMPHNGTDFGAPLGTPVYAAFRGKIAFIGPQGPSGNLVLIDHAGGIQTGYAHLSRFADGLKVGEPIGTRQLVGYVGSTGRSTGPHLHFSAKRDGKFFDALELKLDALQLLPASERALFLQQKTGYDAALEAIQLPEPPPAEATPEPAAPSADKPEQNPEQRSADAEDNAGAGDGDAGSPRESGDGEKKSDKPPAAAPAGGNRLVGEDLSGDVK